MRLDQHSIELQLYDNLTSSETPKSLRRHRDQLAVATQLVQSLGRRITDLQAALVVANADLSAAEQQDAAEADRPGGAGRDVGSRRRARGRQ